MLDTVTEIRIGFTRNRTTQTKTSTTERNPAKPSEPKVESVESRGFVKLFKNLSKHTHRTIIFTKLSTLLSNYLLCFQTLYCTGYTPSTQTHSTLYFTFKLSTPLLNSRKLNDIHLNFVKIFFL